MKILNQNGWARGFSSTGFGDLSRSCHSFKVGNYKRAFAQGCLGAAKAAGWAYLAYKTFEFISNSSAFHEAGAESSPVNVGPEQENFSRPQNPANSIIEERVKKPLSNFTNGNPEEEPPTPLAASAPPTKIWELVIGLQSIWKDWYGKVLKGSRLLFQLRSFSAVMA